MIVRALSPTWIGLVAVAVSAGCASGDANPAEPSPDMDGGAGSPGTTSTNSDPLNAAPTTTLCPSGGCAVGDTNCSLNTFIGNNYIQIDKINASGDANLFVLNGDPNTPVQLTGSGATFIDWDDPLITASGNIGEHVLRDSGQRDPTWLPGGGDASCIDIATSTPDKADLTMAAAASNDDYVYLHVQRQDNSGDGAYYWLFTRQQPTIAPNGSCTQYLTYDISVGDVLIKSLFQPSSDPTSDPFLTICTAVSTLSGVTVGTALDYSTANMPWNCTTALPNAIAAINTSNAGVSSGLGDCTVNDLDASGNMSPEIIAEAAIPITTFGSGSTCGRHFWGTVVSRASAGGTTNTDMKDIIGPAQFNFGGIATTPTVTQRCDGRLDLSATAKDTLGTTITLTSCDWTVDGTALSIHLCSFTTSTSYAAGAHTITVVGHAGAGCDSAQASKQFTVQPHIGALATMSSTCASTLAYGSTYSNTTSPVAYHWTWSPGAPAGFTDGSAGQSGLAATAGVTYTATVTITEQAPQTGFSEACSASAMASTTPLAPITVGIVAGAVPACGASSDVVQYTATAGGGSGSYTFVWHGTPGATAASCDVTMPTASTTDACSFGSGGVDDCVTENLTVTVDDTDPRCAAMTSSAAVYHKVTTISATGSM